PASSASAPTSTVAPRRCRWRPKRRRSEACVAATRSGARHLLVSVARSAARRGYAMSTMSPRPTSLSDLMSTPNRLARETSLYLRQHANNPVDWYPWGPEALARARELDRPIFLSVGYSACHWCHVMEHESFEDE